MKQTWISKALVVSAGVLWASATGAMAASVTPTLYDPWQAGDAGFECAAIGSYAYGVKVDEGGAPNGSTEADFFDIDGELVHSNTVTISNSNGSCFDWSAAPNTIGAVIVKAGPTANVYIYDPQQPSDSEVCSALNQNSGNLYDVSHVTFCWNLDQENEELDQWCSPGYWRQEHHFDSWEATGYDPSDLFSVVLGYTPPLSKLGQKGGATTNPSLFQVLSAPQFYGGDAFNAVGDLLSAAHPDVNFNGTRVEDSCPLN